MTKRLTLDDITKVDTIARTVTHTSSGVSIAYPETPAGKLSTLFRLMFQGKSLDFTLRWELKKGKKAEMLMCAPKINDDAKRNPQEDPLQMLVEEVYACLWAYTRQADPDVQRVFTMVYRDNIYTGDVRIPMKREVN